MSFFFVLACFMTISSPCGKSTRGKFLSCGLCALKFSSANELFVSVVDRFRQE